MIYGFHEQYDGKLIEDGNGKIKEGTRMIMYPHHKAYARDVILHEQPDVTAQELATKLGIPLGEALVILYELRKTKPEGKNSNKTGC